MIFGGWDNLLESLQAMVGLGADPQRNRRGSRFAGKVVHSDPPRAARQRTKRRNKNKAARKMRQKQRGK